MRSKPTKYFLWCAAWAALANACVLEESEWAEHDAVGEHTYAATVPAKGSATTLDVACWNIEWFGSSGNGPSNENLQLNNAIDVVKGTDFDIWGLAEIVSTTQFNSLLAGLPGYSGFLANSSQVTSGSSYYSTSEQKVGILYKSSVASVTSARIILTSYDYEFAGRPPLEVTMNVTVNGTTQQLVVIVLHAKAMADSTSWQRRQNASNALKSYLDSTHSTRRVLVIGDFNDDVDTSIVSGYSSPYQNFVNDSADYEFVTEPLSLARISSTTSYPDMIDHHLATNDMAFDYVAGSAEVHRVDQYISNYSNSTSDHFPVLSRYALGGSGGGGGGGDGGGGGTAQVIINEIRANEPGSDVGGEFVELVNIGTGPADLSGWTISDGSQVRHLFASGTTLAAGKAIVVFASSSKIPANLSNAVAATSGGLNLSNSGDTVRLADSTAVTKDSFTYSSSLSGQDGVSMNRSPDATATGAFVLHNTLGSSSSPGMRPTGSAY